MSGSYRAWRARAFGEPSEVLELARLPRPTPAPDHVSIAVECAGVNLPDVLLVGGTYQLRPDPPFTPGREVVGRVVETPDLRRWPPGTRVVARPLLPHGGYAELTIARARDVFAVPDEVAAPDAAALLVTHLTAHVALHHRAGLRAGETVVVLGGAGGVGSAAIQLAKAAGATVVATAAGAQRVRACRSLGADVVVDRLLDDVPHAIREATGGRGAEVIVDAVGGDLFALARKALAWEGRAVLVGTAAGAGPTVDGTAVLLRNQTILGLHLGPYQDHAPEVTRTAFAELVAMVGARTVRPVIAEVLPLDRALTALERIRTGGVVGKLILRV